MSADTLVHVARLPSLTPPEALWLDTQALQFVVVPLTNGDEEATATPVEEYLTQHPDRTDIVRAALLSRFGPPPVIPGGGAAFLARKQRVDAEALARAVTPENRHPETATGPTVGKEVW